MIHQICETWIVDKEQTEMKQDESSNNVRGTKGLIHHNEQWTRAIFVHKIENKYYCKYSIFSYSLSC